MNNLDAILHLINNELDGANSDEACDRLISVLTAHIELADILDSIEDATSLMDTYEATADYIEETAIKLADEVIKCDSVFKRIKEDVEMERFKGVTYEFI